MHFIWGNVIGLALFSLGSYADVRSSINRHEANPLMRDKDGFFRLKLNVDLTLVALGLSVLLMYLIPDGGFLGAGMIGVVRISIALHNGVKIRAWKISWPKSER